MSRWVCLAGLLPALLAAGCKREQAAALPPRAPEVQVSTPLSSQVQDFELFTGRTEAGNRVDIRARVTGYLAKADFIEGARVNQDQVLFVIDRRPYEAEEVRAEAALTQARATARRADADYKRALDLYSRQATTREEFDLKAGINDESAAAVKVAEANLALARLNLQFTEVRAPFAGRISRRMIDPGNLVKADDTILSTLIADEPMYAYFDVDERTLLRQLIDGGVLSAAQSSKVTVQVGLADEEGYPHTATVNFVDNKVDPGTGTLWMRGVFEKPKRSIAAGMFVRVRFPLGQPYQALLAAEQAVGTDQGQKFVFVVDSKNKVEYRPVQVGRLHDGLRVIKDGLKPGERVVVTGLQRVRAGAEVTVKEVPMPVREARGKPADPRGGKPAGGG
jgi:RND family efflux transporter MFP subunit